MRNLALVQKYSYGDGRMTQGVVLVFGGMTMTVSTPTAASPSMIVASSSFVSAAAPLIKGTPASFATSERDLSKASRF